MIIVRLQGGLGNQMFQYAFAKYHAIKNNTKLILDTTPFRGNYPRPYELDCFNITEKTINLKSIKPIWELSKTILFNKLEYYQLEPIPELDKIKDKTYILGYFIWLKHILKIEPVLRDYFTFKHPLSFANAKLKNEILNCHSVSLHIRRGDFLLGKNTNYNVCNKDYYLNAIQKIRTVIKNPTFFIFSDDPKWVKQEFIKNEFIVVDNKNKGCDDMHLMTLCNHNIISNSTFSWWGAWLNKNIEKIVVAPESWSLNKEKDEWLKKNLLPKKWFLMDNL